MLDLQQFLKEFLNGSKKLLIIGVGSEFMADDIAGVMIAGELLKKFKTNENNNLKILIGNTAPENFTGEIKRFNPDRLIIIDAADLKEKPGSVMIIDTEVINGVSFSTHMLPLKVMIQYIKKEIGCKIAIIGIQPKIVIYGEKITSKVKEAIEDITKTFIYCINVYMKNCNPESLQLQK